MWLAPISPTCLLAFNVARLFLAIKIVFNIFMLWNLSIFHFRTVRLCFIIKKVSYSLKSLITPVLFYYICGFTLYVQVSDLLAVCPGLGVKWGFTCSFFFFFLSPMTISLFLPNPPSWFKCHFLSDHPSQSLFHLSPLSVALTEFTVICKFKNICLLAFLGLSHKDVSPLRGGTRSSCSSAHPQQLA